MKAHCSHCNRVQDLISVAGSKDSGFCPGCRTRIELEPAPDPTAHGRRKFVKRVMEALTAISYGVIANRMSDFIRKPSPVKPLQVSVSDSLQIQDYVDLKAGMSPFHGTFVYELIPGPNAPGNQHHGQV